MAHVRRQGQVLGNASMADLAPNKDENGLGFRPHSKALTS